MSGDIDIIGAPDIFVEPIVQNLPVVLRVICVMGCAEIIARAKNPTEAKDMILAAGWVLVDTLHKKHEQLPRWGCPTHNPTRREFAGYANAKS